MQDLKLSKVNNIDVIEFHKHDWMAEQIHLALCFNFDVNTITNIITCTIRKTSKRSLFEFIKYCFQNPVTKDYYGTLSNEAIRNAFYSQIASIYKSLALDVDAKITELLPYAGQLFNHQKEVLQESYYKQFNFLAMEMGTGKTLTSASLSRLWQSKCTLIICPSVVKWNWYRDLCRFKFNELFFTILDASKKRSIKGFQERFVILNYEMQDRFFDYIKTLPVDHIIYDESHFLKNISSKRTHAAIRIVKFFPNANVTLLSGTPIKNRVDDIYAYLKLTHHELGKKKEDFLKRYTVRDNYRVTGGKDLNDLRLKMSNFMIRKTKIECLDLPEKMFLSYRYELDDYKVEYDRILSELSNQKSYAAANGNIHSLNNLTAKSKVKGVIEIANSILEQDKKVVIFAGYTEPIEMLERHFGDSCVKITGSVNSFDRDALIQKFYNDPKCNVFVANYQAAGVGINLTNASDVIFVNFPFSDAEFQQSIDRLHRIGAKNNINIHLTFCDDSVDDDIYEIIVSKAVDANKVVDGHINNVVDSESFTKKLMSKLFKDRANDLYVSPPLGDSQEAEEAVIVPADVYNSVKPAVYTNDSRAVTISEPIITANELPEFL